MAAHLTVNEALLQEALALNDQISIDALVELALREYIQRRKRLKVLELFGTIDYDEDIALATNEVADLPVRSHDAFLNGYSPEDEGLYDDCSSG